MQHDLVLWFFITFFVTTHVHPRAFEHVNKVSNYSSSGLSGICQWTERWGLWHGGMQFTIWWNCQRLTHSHTRTHSGLNPSILCPRSGPLAPVSMHSHWLGCAAADTANHNASRDLQESDWYVVRFVRNALIFFRVASDYSWKKTKPKG